MLTSDWQASAALLATAPYQRARRMTGKLGPPREKPAEQHPHPYCAPSRLGFLLQVLSTVHANCCPINRAKMKSAPCPLDGGGGAT